MQNKFPKIQLILSTIFFVFSCLIFVFFYRFINNKNQELQLKEIEWQNEALRRDEIKTLEHSIKAVESERQQLETHFAQKSDVVPFLDTIEELAPKAGAKAEITSVDVFTARTGLYVGLKASGTFSSLYKFLVLLENSPYELEFLSTDMHIETGSDESQKTAGAPKWNAVFKIKLLSFIQ